MRQYVMTSPFGEGGAAVTLLPALVERSLVVVDRRAGSNRYRLLETLREYGRAQLEPDEAHECRRRHLHWYLELAERAEVGIRGPGYRDWLDVLNSEHVVTSSNGSPPDWHRIRTGVRDNRLQ